MAITCPERRSVRGKVKRLAANLTSPAELFRERSNAQSIPETKSWGFFAPSGNYPELLKIDTSVTTN